MMTISCSWAKIPDLLSVFCSYNNTYPLMFKSDLELNIVKMSGLEIG